ncbi:MAG: PAS domain S-box protein, partial [Proteobacteria bacterium]|nr:PAS domain S-box protein [Pseudomonadota bacterium]
MPISRRNTRLSRRLIAYMVAFSSALTLVITAYQLYRDYDRDLRLIESRMRQVQYVHLNSLVDTLWATNTKKLQIHLDGILRLPDMQYVAVKEGERLWASAGTFQSDNVISREFPMNYVHRGRTLEIGTLSVVATLDGVYQRLIDKTLIILLSNGIKTFLVAGFMLLIFQYLVTRHLDTLARYARGLNLDNLPNPLWLKRKSKGRRAPDELDEVVAAINDMRVDMEESFEALRENEERLRAVVDSIVVGVITIDETGVVQSFNRGAESMFGYAPAEVVGENVTILMPEVHRSGHGSYIANYLRTGEAKIIGIGREVEGRRKDGSIFPMELEIGAMVVGGQRMFAGIVKDITERKRAEEALRESEASLANAQRIAHVGNWDWNIETSELGWSDEIYRIFGLKPQQFGATYGAFLNTVHAEDRALVQEAVNRSLEEKTPYAIDHRIVLPDGTVRVVHEEG